jgi:hypothetical protein
MPGEVHPVAAAGRIVQLRLGQEQHDVAAVRCVIRSARLGGRDGHGMVARGVEPRRDRRERARLDARAGVGPQVGAARQPRARRPQLARQGAGGDGHRQLRVPLGQHHPGEALAGLDHHGVRRVARARRVADEAVVAALAVRTGPEQPIRGHAHAPPVVGLALELAVLGAGPYERERHRVRAARREREVPLPRASEARMGEAAERLGAKSPALLRLDPCAAAGAHGPTLGVQRHAADLSR